MNQTRTIHSIHALPGPSDENRTPARKAVDSGDEINLLGLLFTLWNGKWLIALCLALAVAGSVTYLKYVATPMFQATATVVLENRQEQVVDLQNVMSGLSGDQATVNTEVEVIRSRGLARKLVSELSLLEDPEFNRTLRTPSPFSPSAIIAFLTGGDAEPTAAAILNKTVENVLKATSVSNARQTYVFSITMETTSPEKSALMANTLAEVYIADQLAVKYAATDTAVEWLANRVSELKIEVEEAEQAAKNFNASTDLISPEALELLNRQVKDLRGRIDEAGNNFRSAETALVSLTTARDSGDMPFMAQVAEDPALDRIMVSEADNAPEAFFARFDQIVARVEQERDRAGAQLAALESSYENLNARIEAQSDDLVQLQQLRREAEATGTIYTYFLNRLKETEVQRGIQQPDSRMLSEAVIPQSKSAPRSSMVLALGMILGLGVGVTVVLGREALQNTFRSAEELADHTGARVLGTIPRIPVRKRGQMLSYIVNKPTSSAAESIRNLRTSLMLSNVDHPPQVILSTSSIPSEGKTTLSILMAQNLASLGKKVLLIEGDMRRRVFSSYFDMPAHVGLVGVLTGSVPLEEAVGHDKTLGIDILPSEHPNANAADLYSSDRFGEMLAEMRQEYDIIILDTPPVLVVPDARVAARHVDAVVFSVRWDSTQKQQVSAAIDMFTTVGVKVTGLVLSQVDPKGLKRYGYGQYGGYGGNYGGYYQN